MITNKQTKNKDKFTATVKDQQFLNHYRRVENGFLLHSIGANFLDWHLLSGFLFIIQV